MKSRYLLLMLAVIFLSVSFGQVQRLEKSALPSITNPTVLQKAGDVVSRDMSHNYDNKGDGWQWEKPQRLWRYEGWFINSFTVFGGDLYGVGLGGSASIPNSLQHRDVMGNWFRSPNIKHPEVVRVCEFMGEQRVFVTDWRQSEQRSIILSFNPEVDVPEPDTLLTDNIYPNEMDMTTSDSMMSMFMGKHELFVNESKNGVDWNCIPITGIPGSFGNVSPGDFDAAYYPWCNSRVVAVDANVENMGICFEFGDGKWYTQIFKSCPYVNAPLGGPIGRRLALLNDGRELMIAFRNGEEPNQLVILYCDPPVLIGWSAWITWPYETYEFDAEIRGIAHNSNTVVVATNKAVYVIPLYKFRKHVADMFNCGTSQVDMLALPGSDGYVTYVTGVDINSQNDIYLGLGANRKTEIWLYKNVSFMTLVNNVSTFSPTDFVLQQNYPNPFNPTTTIDFSLPAGQNVELSIYNVLGQKIATLINENMDAGNHNVQWYGLNEYGLPVSSGIYFCRLQAGSNIEVRKMHLLKALSPNNDFDKKLTAINCQLLI